MIIRRMVLRRLDLPLTRPYRLAYRTFETFEPFMVEIEDTAGRRSASDAHVSPGSSAETRDGAWRFLQERAKAAIGRPVDEAKADILDHFETSKVATTALVTAIEILENNGHLHIDGGVALPLLAPVNALDAAGIEQEMENGIARGFATFKVKVGKDVAADLLRVETIRKAVAGRATLRLDANRAYNREDAVAFASRLDPEGIELFEQPCDADDWEANTAVAEASPVPLMLDEPICTLADIRRAGDIRNVGFCKLKLKRFGGIDRLVIGLRAVRENGMEPVLGDGLGSELHNWLEACAARSEIRNAGEFNGFLKPRERLFRNPMPFEAGEIRLPPGYQPELDEQKIELATRERAVFEA